MPPWLYPMKWQSCVLKSGCPPDWNEFSAIYDVSYTDPDDQQVVLQLAQLLWDRGENEGYAEHITSHPYTGISAKQVFIIENYGDHQVSNTAAEILYD